MEKKSVFINGKLTHHKLFVLEDGGNVYIESSATLPTSTWCTHPTVELTSTLIKDESLK
jgi:hypothetical protein